ncbi:MAG TPA: fluoride efflux transporter CrcB [Gaiellaceae bacterium]|jgi:CrcB protein|nr:fluoride efflux transporter CrcB [Gaiellaceae bacterium]
MTVLDWIGLALVGGVGAVLRYLVDGWVQGRYRGEFPLGTFAVNVCGTFALGVLTGAHLTGAALFIVGTGLIGAFTTFSTWMYETQRLLEDGEVAVAGWNVAASIAAGLAAGGAGWALGALA